MTLVFQKITGQPALLIRVKQEQKFFGTWEDMFQFLEVWLGGRFSHSEPCRSVSAEYVESK
jgi:hypothetical protein